MKKSSKHQYRVRNWKQYNAALVKRGSLTVWFSQEAIDAWINAQMTGKKGASNYYSDTAILCMLTLKAVYRLRLRQTEGLMLSLCQLMQITLDVPDFSTLSRRGRDLEVALGVKRSSKSLHLVVDSTGVKIYGEGEWKVRQHGYSKRRTWRKLHLGIDEATNEIVASVLSDNSVSDDTAFSDVIEQVGRPIRQVTADAAYDKRKVYEAIGRHQARAVIPPHKGARIWKHGNTAGERLDRDENLRAIRRHGKAAWKRQSDYHRRSKAETGVYRFKTIFGDRLDARTFARQAVEVFVKCAALNTMMRLGMPESYRVD
jgi:hypothetical protein